MDNHTYALWTHDRPQHHLVRSNISFTPGSRTPGPTNRPSRILPPSAPPAPQELPTPSHVVAPPIREFRTLPLFIPSIPIELPTPPPSVPATPATPQAPQLYHLCPPETKSSSATDEEQVPATGDLKSAYVQQCIEQYNQWRSGDGESSSPDCSENGLVIEMGIRDFIDFKKALNIDEDEKFPRYSYNASSSTLHIQSRPSPLHEKAISAVSEGFAIARRSLPTNLRRKIHIVANQDFDQFSGAYKNFEKTPDATVEVTNAAGIIDVKFVLEVGLSETYQQLVQDATMWLEGTDAVSLVMIVKLQESPSYTCPTRGLCNEEFAQQGFAPRQKIDVNTFALGGPYGPAYYLGFAWVGEISGFMEVWWRDPMSGMATRKSGPTNIFNMTDTSCVFFWLHDFIDVAPEDDHRIPINWGDYLDNLGLYVRQMAAKRCRRMLKDREGLVDLRDDDYQP